jgi:Cu+-exporting ATPase
MGKHAQTILTNTPLSIPIEGMTCAACAQRLEKLLNRLDGVQASVNFATETAQVSTETLMYPELEAAIRRAGFAVATQSYNLKIGGMTCAACATRIEKQLNQLQMINAQVNFASEIAQIVAPMGAYSAIDLITVIEQAGYRATDANTESIQHQPTQLPWLLLLSSLCTLPFIVDMVLMLIAGGHALPATLQLLLATTVQFIPGWRFYRGSLLALRAKSANMDVLVALGTTAAWAYSVWALSVGDTHHLYFEASASVITLVLLGKWLETRAKQRTGAALSALLALQPQTAMVLRDQHWIELPISDLVQGDVVQIRDGETAPIDGQIIQGQLDIDEAMLTGESASISKTLGDTVFAGTKNLGGSAQIRVSALGQQTELAHIIKMVSQAQGSKAPIQQLADRVSGIFVPCILLIALGTLLITYALTGQLNTALIHAVTVLVIACPCALGLATPTAVMVGVGLAAQRGILFRNATALELSSKIDTLIVDKTGTLTMGQPELVHTEILPGHPLSYSQILLLATSLEAASQHPLAHAFKTTLGQQELPATEHINTSAGFGVQGQVSEYQVQLGRPKWVLSAEQYQALNTTIEEYQQLGHTVIAMAVDTLPCALFMLQDQIRPSSLPAIEQLKASGIEVIMLTGDHASSAQRVAQALGIDQFQANCSPEDKFKHLIALQQAGKIVAMAGDGINDAPALAGANVSFAMQSGSSIALETADITLMHNDIAHISTALALSAATLRKIRQNLFFAFIYNILGIPLAAVGLLSPMIAGAAMALSSVSVISNALLLRRFKG